ncbi:MAG: ABC transporter permease [Rhodospirillales bacterium]|nr:ABC transporter permease [Rhodospirillales bacterium]
MKRGTKPEPISHEEREWAAGLENLGRQVSFYGTALRSSAKALTGYKKEVLRLLGEMSLGTGALAVVGGTVVVTCLLTFAVGGIVGVQGYNNMDDIGVSSMAAVFASVIDTRIIAPAIAGIGIVATLGAGTTAELGARRVSEEIDALEVMAVRPVAFLVSTRIIAGVLVVIPLFLLATMASYWSSELWVKLFYGQSGGVYDHYFNRFLVPLDIVMAGVSTLVATALAMLIHTYYGYHATGGPAGVGEAVGKSVRSSMVVVLFVDVAMALALFGNFQTFHISG